MVEQRPPKPKVVGSIPITDVFIKVHYLMIFKKLLLELS